MARTSKDTTPAADEAATPEEHDGHTISVGAADEVNAEIELADPADEVVAETTADGWTAGGPDPSFTDEPGQIVEYDPASVEPTYPPPPIADSRVILENIAVAPGLNVTSWFGIDDEGHYAGGRSEALGVRIDWQNGPVPIYGWNGATIEDVLTCVSQRLRFFQSGPTACQENAEAIGHIERALTELRVRTDRRTNAGTAGTYEGN